MRSLDLSCFSHKGKVIHGNAALRTGTCVLPASLHSQELQLFLFPPEPDVSCALLLCLTWAGSDAVGPGCSCWYCHSCPALLCSVRSQGILLPMQNSVLEGSFNFEILRSCCLFRRHPGDRTAAFGGKKPGSPANNSLFLSGQ